MEEEYARPALRRDRMVMIHWYYFPDSHDSWASMDLPVDPPDSPAPRNEPWRVSSVFFNFHSPLKLVRQRKSKKFWLEIFYGTVGQNVLMP